MTLTIRTAATDDLDAVVALRIDAETWLHAAGINQWRNHERGVRNIRDGIADGTTYVVTDPDDTVVASLTLAGPDFNFWTREDNPGAALYLYKLIISSHWRGIGLGDELLDWACTQAQHRGKHWLRLDCWRTNTALHAYYQARGFHHIRTEVVSGRESGALFERPASTQLSTPRLLANHEHQPMEPL